MKTAIILALLLSACTATHRSGDFSADQLSALGPLLKGERP